MIKDNEAFAVSSKTKQVFFLLSLLTVKNIKYNDYYY